jgi:DNA polymerase III subunit beta
MKITCNREHLLSAFQVAASVAPTRSPKPILRNVKLEASESGTTLTATDLEVGIRLTVEGVEVESPGTILVPVGQVRDILRESADEVLTISADNQCTTVLGQRSEFKMPSENPDDFPNVVTFSEGTTQEVSCQLFRELARRTLFATDEGSARYSLGGVLFELCPNRIIAVSTDGRRLAKMEGDGALTGEPKDNTQPIIVPSRALQLMSRAVAEEGIVLIAARANDIAVQSNGAVIVSRLIEGRFPKWRDVLPSSRNSTKVDVSAGVLNATVRQAAISASETGRGVDFTLKDETLILAASHSDRGESRIEMPVAYKGPQIVFTLDYRFVTDFLKALEPEKAITMDVLDGASAVVFRTHDGYEYVVMPLAPNS